MNEVPELSMGGTDPLRQCALVLHSMAAQDRKWLLANLQGGMVAQLEQLLGELRVLGIPPEPRLTQTALKAAIAARDRVRVTAAAKPQRLGQAGETQLQREHAKSLGELLRGEPVGLIARVLGPRGAIVQKSVLAHLHHAQRRQVKERLAATRSGTLGALAPRSSRALDEEISLQLQRRRDRAEPRRGADAIRGAMRLLRFGKGQP